MNDGQSRQPAQLESLSWKLRVGSNDSYLPADIAADVSDVFPGRELAPGVKWSVLRRYSNIYSCTIVRSITWCEKRIKIKGQTEYLHSVQRNRPRYLQSRAKYKKIIFPATIWYTYPGVIL